MNKRIQELADQAKLSIPQGMYEPDVWIQEYNRRFAELIVKECASIYDKIDNGNLHQGTDNYLEALQRHFGIES